MEDGPSLNGETPRLGYHWRLVHRAHSIRVAKVIMGGQIYPTYHHCDGCHDIGQGDLASGIDPSRSGPREESNAWHFY